MSTLGVVVLSLQGMKHLSECLESVRWAEAVTLLHAGEEAPTVGVSAFPSLTLRKFSSTQELAEHCQGVKTDWVLHLWGEERVEAVLREELRAVCQKELPQAPLGYRISIRSRLLGRWVEGSLLGPSPALRLSRRVEEIPTGWWDATRHSLRQYPVLGRGWIGDYSAAELREGFDRVQNISELWAERLQTRWSKLTPMACLLCPLRVFIKMLLMNGIFSNGFAGLTLSTLAAYATLLASAKVWEARNVKSIAK